MNRNLPSYFSFSDKRLAEFMSELGIPSDPQRKIFSLLIQTRSTRIDYDTFLSRNESSSGIRNFEAELLSLMRKLKSRSYGMVLSRVNVEGVKKNYAVILLEEDDPLFYYYLLLDIYDTSYNEPSLPFLTTADLKRRGISFPQDVPKELKKTDISDSFFNEAQELKEVYFLSYQEEDVIPIPSTRLKSFISFCITKVKYVLGFSSVTDWLSRNLSLSIRHVTGILQEADLNSLKSFSHVILEKKVDFCLFAKMDEKDDFFKALDVLILYLQNQENLKKEKENEEQNFIQLMGKISEEISQGEEWLSLDDLTKIISSHYSNEKSFKEFKVKAIDYLIGSLRERGSGETPILYEFQGKFIHRNNVFPFFERSFAASVPIMRKYLVILAQNALDQSVSTIFSSQIHIEKEMVNELAAKFPFVLEMLSKPKVLTEYIFFYMREIQGIKSIDKIKEKVLYFAPFNNPEVIPLLDIYNFSLKSIFEEAYRSFPLLKKIIFYITGRYASYLQKAKNLDVIRYQSKSSSGGIADQYSLDKEEGNSPSSSKYIRRGGKKAPIEEKKPYSKGEINKAWDDFGKNLKE